MPLLLRDRAQLTAPTTLLTARDAAAAGIRPTHRTHHRVRAGVWTPLAHWQSLAPWERYAARVHAYLRICPDAILCLESAAVIHGIPLFGEARDIHVYDPSATKSTRFGDVVVHASADARDVVTVEGILVTSMVDTVVDLARVLPPAQALTVADAAVSPVQGGVLRLEQLRDRAAGQINSRGRARLRWVWDRVNGVAESPAEVVSRAVIEWTGFEEPVQQPVFHYEGHTDRTDFGFRSNRALCEADGWGKYDLDDPARAEAHLRNEKTREDRLRRHGHPFGRWDGAGATKVTPLVRALQATGLRPCHPEQPAMLATLRRSPRTL
ncbi:hypothetical protein [Microbacterium aurum]